MTGESRTIDFWFALGSTYTYLTVMRLQDVEDGLSLPDRKVSFKWRPYSVRTITREMNNSPFTGKPVKAAYMWRDIERRAAWYGFPARVPAPYPIKEFDLANLVATVAAAEGWCAAYTRASYRRWFQEGLEPGSEPNLSDSIQEAQQDPERVITLARGTDAQQALGDATDEARSLGIFGSPTFSVGREIFWGDDRLEDAIKWLELPPLG